MIIITKDNISNYLTNQDINIIDKNINKRMLFSGLNELIKDIKDNKDNNCKIIYNHKYYFISILYIYYHCYNKIIIINKNNFNDIKIYIKFDKDWGYFNMIKNIDVYFYCYTNTKIINYYYKTIAYYTNYKIIKIGTKVKKIFLNYYYIYYKNYSSLYYYNNYLLLILKTYKYRNYIRIKSNLNNIIYNLLFFVYIN